MLKVNVHSIVFCFARRFFASRHVASVLTKVKGQLLIKHLNKDLSESVSNSNSLTNWSVCKGKVKKVNHVFEQKRKGESLWSCRFFCLHFFLVLGGGRWKKSNMFHFVNLFLKCWTYQLECHMSDQIHWSLSGRLTLAGFSLVRSHPSSGTSLHCTSGSVRRR